MYKVQGYAMGKWCLWKEMPNLQDANEEAKRQCDGRWMDFRVVDMDTDIIEFMVFFDFESTHYRPLKEAKLDWRKYGF